MSNSKQKTEIFISYRRTAGWELARLIYQELTDNKFNVFFDIEKLFKGKFDQKIKSKLLECQIFIPIITRDTLKRCVNNPDDWVSQEIKLAIEHKLKIIPVFAGSYLMPKKIDNDIKEALLTKNVGCIEFSQDFLSNPISNDVFKQKMHELCNLILKNLSISKRKKQNISRFTVKRVCKKNNLLETTASFSTARPLNDMEMKLYENASEIDKDTEFIKDFIYKNCLSDRNILEIGGRNGLFAVKLISKMSTTISSYVSIEPNSKDFAMLKVALRKFFPKSIETQALHLFPDDNKFKKQLNQLVKENSKQFSIAIFYHSLYQYKNPMKIIKDVYSVLKPNGVVIIVENDTGANFSYPDNLGIIHQYNEIKKSIKQYGNANTGREIWHYMSNIGLEPCIYTFFVDEYMTNVENIFNLKDKYQYPGYTKNKCKILDEIKWIISELSNKKDSPIATAQIKWLGLYKDAIVEQLFTTSCFHVTTKIIGCGFKRK